jgi:ADP-heptose:LPS heptosyltransferase
MKIFGTRFSLIGDIVMSLPILDYLKDKYGEYYMYFSIAKKCEQSAPIFYNHPLINSIKISDYHEDLGENDFEIISKCDLVFNVKPPHPQEQDWYNYRNCIEETALMAGLDPKLFKDKVPSLKQYWDDEHIYEKTIAIWPFAGYGQGLERSPSKDWWELLISRLINNGYKILHFGVDNEPNLSNNENYKKITNLSFFEQIKYSLCCNAVIGTDSGSMWVTAAYNKIPQINLITNWLPNHFQNKLALAPIGEKTINLYADNGCSNISIEETVFKINEIFRI